MKFAEIAEFFERMEVTSKRLELTEILVEILKNTPINVISKVTYLIRGKLRHNFEGFELVIAVIARVLFSALFVQRYS